MKYLFAAVQFFFHSRLCVVRFHLLEFRQHQPGFHAKQNGVDHRISCIFVAETATDRMSGLELCNWARNSRWLFALVSPLQSTHRIDSTFGQHSRLTRNIFQLCRSPASPVSECKRLFAVPLRQPFLVLRGKRLACRLLRHFTDRGFFLAVPIHTITPTLLDFDVEARSSRKAFNWSRSPGHNQAQRPGLSALLPWSPPPQRRAAP